MHTTRSRRARRLFALGAAALACSAPRSAPAEEGAALPREPSPAGARVYFISPSDGDTTTSPVTVRFGLRGMGVAPAGIPFANSGHHHLIVNGETPPPDQPIPSDAQHLHFGKGQTETELELPPGPHTLQLVLGDRSHIPHDPPVVSERVWITVEER